MELEEAARAGAYALVTRLMRGPPDAALLKSLADMPALNEDESPLGESWRMLTSASAVLDERDVNDEFRTLFLGVESTQVYPYGSIHLSGYFMAGSLAALRTDLSRIGLTTRRTVREPEDHIASLCEAMRFMLSRDATGESKPLEIQERFFRRHIAPWYEAFTDQLEQAPAAIYYRTVARFARAFLDLESHSLALVTANECDLAAETET